MQAFHGGLTGYRKALSLSGFPRAQRLTFPRYSQPLLPAEIFARGGETRRCEITVVSRERFGVFSTPSLWQSNGIQGDSYQAVCSPYTYQGPSDWMRVLSLASQGTELSLASQAKNRQWICMQNWEKQPGAHHSLWCSPSATWFLRGRT